MTDTIPSLGGVGTIIRSSEGSVHPVDRWAIHVLVSKSRSLQNRGPYIHYYVDEDRDLAIHNVLIPTIYTYILMNI